VLRLWGNLKSALIWSPFLEVRRESHVDRTAKETHKSFGILCLSSAGIDDYCLHSWSSSDQIRPPSDSYHSMLTSWRYDVPSFTGHGSGFFQIVLIFIISRKGLTRYDVRVCVEAENENGKKLHSEHMKAALLLECSHPISTSLETRVAMKDLNWRCQTSCFYL
jgi:hypothetical protein